MIKEERLAEMIGLKEYMKQINVTKIEYVRRWIENDYIPGVVKAENIFDTKFPDSARRPYCERHLKPGISADKLRAHIVKACLLRRHISKELCFTSALEFEGLVSELEKAGFIRKRIEDGITYFDSTLKSETSRGKSLKVLREFILDTLKSVSESAAEGTVTAILKHQMAG